MGLLSGLTILAMTSEFPPFRGGIGTYAAGLAAGAAALGADVTVLAPDYGCAAPELPDMSCLVIRFPGGRHTARHAVAKLRLTRAAIRRPGATYDLVHAMDWPFFIPAALCTRPGQRRLLTIHGSDVNDMAHGLKRLAIAAARVFAPPSEVVANSAYSLGLLRARFPAIAPASLRHAHLGVDGFWHEPVPRGTAARARLGLPPDKFLLLTVGRLTRRKGQLSLVRALDLLPAHARGRLLHLIVGPPTDSDYAAEVAAAIAEAGFDARWLSGVDNATLRDLYANSDALCLAGQDAGDGKVEGFGLVFLEAGAQALPAIACDVGAVGEVVLDRRTGLLVPGGDAAAMAGAVLRLMNDDGLRRTLGAAAQARAGELSWRRCAACTYGQV